MAESVETKVDALPAHPNHLLPESLKAVHAPVPKPPLKPPNPLKIPHLLAGYDGHAIKAKMDARHFQMQAKLPSRPAPVVIPK